LLTETAVIAFAGGAAGLGLSYGAVQYLAQLPGSTVPDVAGAGVNPSVLSFSMVLSLMTAFATGIMPALRASRASLSNTLKAGATGRGRSYRRDRLRTVLVIGEVGLSLVVLAGAGLMLRSFQQLLKIDPGLRTGSILTMRVPLAPETYRQAAQRVRFFEDVLDRVQTLPAVESAGVINELPLQRWGTGGVFAIRGRPKPPAGQEPFAEFRTVSAGYFEAVGVPLVSGRLFSDEEDLSRVVVINRAAANVFWPGDDPLGRQLGWETPDGDASWFTVVGVVGNVRNRALREEPRPELYWPHNGDEFFATLFSHEMTLVVRTALEPRSLVASIQNQIWQVDAQQPVHLVKTMEEVAADAVAGPRFQTLLFAIFASFALLLCLVGVYGVVSYDVSCQTHEIGIRMALGAQRREVLRLVLGYSLVLALTGIAVGVGVALALTRFLENQLYGIEPNDPTTFAAVALILVVTTLAASYVPARRAARVDPMAALRHQ
jgi:putative ABC transport system permease protein